MNTKTNTNPPKKKLIDRILQRMYELNQEATARKNARREQMQAFIKTEVDAGRGVPNNALLMARYGVCEATVRKDLQEIGFSLFELRAKRRAEICAYVRAYFAEHGALPVYKDVAAKYGVSEGTVGVLLRREGLNTWTLAKARRARIKAFVLAYQAEHGKLPAWAVVVDALGLRLQDVQIDFRVLRLRDRFTLPLNLDMPYASPHGTMRDYLRWRLPRVLIGDTFVLRGVNFTRSDDLKFRVVYGIRSVVIVGKDMTQLLERIFIGIERRLCRLHTPTIERYVLGQRRTVLRQHQRGMSKAEIAAGRGVALSTVNDWLIRGAANGGAA